MGHKSKKRSKSSNPTNEENSPEKLKNERTMTSSEDISPENEDVKNPILNGKKRKKSKKEKSELSELKVEEPVEEKDATESENKSKSKKKKRKLEKKTTASDEVTQNVEETENSLKVKKKKSKEEDSEVDTEEEEKSAENGEEDSAVKKKKSPSKRQLKKQKQELREKEKREATKMESATKVLNYISKWKHARSEWKFEKVKQIWLVNNLLDESLVPEKFYPTVLEYFEGCKGMVKDQLSKKAMAVIKKMEDLSEESEDVVESIEYQRARQLLQALPSET